MGTFTPAHGLPVLVRHDNPAMPFETAAPVRFENDITDITIPAGFELDFASVPRPLWWLFPRVGRYARAALVHDALYRKGEVDRVQADALFLAIMRRDGVPRRQRWPMYLAVRVFGWWAWHKLRVAEDEQAGYDWRLSRPTRADWADEITALPWAVVVAAVLTVLALAAIGKGQTPVWGAPAGQSHAEPSPAAVEAAKDSVVRVRLSERSGDSLGSGVCVAHDDRYSYVLSCGHVFDQDCRGGTCEVGRAYVEHRGVRYGAAVVAKDRPNDLTVLRCARLPCAAVPYADSGSGPLYPGGFGGDGRLRFFGGRFHRQAMASGSTAPSVVIGGSVRSGDSGGPVFDASGRVVGVVWGTWDGETYAMHRGPVRAILSRALGRLFRPLTPVPRTPSGDATSPVVEVGPADDAPSGGPPDPVDPGPCQDAAALRTDLDKLRGEVDSFRTAQEAWAANVDDKLAALRDDAQAWRAETRRQIAAIPRHDPAQYVPRDAYEADREASRNTLEDHESRLGGLAQGAAGLAKKVARSKLEEMGIATLGIGGPIGMGLAVGLWLARRKVRRVIENRDGDAREASPHKGFQGW